ncbi:MAG TPA: 4'-phosphopantetheinyl transferase superfamily protein [Mucilaginibacter sp.]|jgi:phosphopantetheinyl transferase (holo-ACP synthase)|nr:4'-phosphopantetheinyl transferase superfamily protein [Mucilaginibacter sp.]
MLGTGNDIVALAAINVERTRQSKFYSKIFSFSEQRLGTEFEPQLSFENFVWLAWSVKESVYKFLQKFMPDLVFSPTKIVITKLELGSCFEDKVAYNGIVQYHSYILYFRTFINEGYIFSVVNFNDDFAETRWGIKKIESSEHTYQSSAVREFLLTDLHKLLPGNNFTIKRSPHGWPLIMNNNKEIPLPVSLAHHDRYVAYSFQLK